MISKKRLAAGLVLAIPLVIANGSLFVWVNRLMEGIAPALADDANGFIRFLDWFLHLPEEFDTWLYGQFGTDLLVSLMVWSFGLWLFVCKPISVIMSTTREALLDLGNAPPEVRRMSNSELGRNFPGWPRVKRAARLQAFRHGYLMTLVDWLKFALFGALVGLETVAIRHLSWWVGFWGTLGSIVLVILLIAVVRLIKVFDSMANEQAMERLFDAFDAF